MDFIKSLALEAGKLGLEESARLQDVDIHFKNEKDLVTSADRKVEAYIIGRIKEEFPGHDIYGEETGMLENGSDYQWVIDPIDGTASFVHELPFYSVSIALRHKGKTIQAAVYSPRLEELFYAEKGHGAFLNEKRLKVSKRTRLVESILATGFACLRENWTDNNLKYFNRIMPVIRDIRRHGSAALDLCYVAAGRFDGFWEMNLKPYDYAAGILIVKEAGGKLCDFEGGSDYSGKGIIATNGKIDAELKQYFRD